MQYKGELALLITATLYGLIGVFSRIIKFDIPFFYQQWSRNLLALIIIFAITKLFSRWKKIKSKDWKWFILRGFSGQLGFMCLYVGFIYLDFATNYFISYATVTIFSYLLGKLFFKEKFTPVKLIALFLAILGLSLIFKVKIDIGKTVFLLLAAASGFFSAVWTIFSKKISRVYSNLEINTIDSVFAAFFPMSLSIIFKEKWAIPVVNKLWGANLIFMMLFIATSFLIVYGFKFVEAQKGSLILLFDIVVGILLGFLLFGETVSLPTLIGGVMIITAMVLPNLKLRKITS